MRLLLLILLFLLATTPASAEGLSILPENIPPLPIRKISFVTQQTLSYDDLMRFVPISVGTQLSAESLQASIIALEKRKIFVNIDVQLTQIDAGVEVEFLLTPALFIFELIFEGNSALDDQQLRRLAGIRLGEPMTLHSLLAAQGRIQTAYRRAGYFFAKARVSISERFIAPQVTVKFFIEEGQVSKFSSISLPPSIPDELAELPKRLNDRAIGAIASEENVKALRQELLSYVRKEGFLQASVDFSELAPDAGSGEVSLGIRFEPREPVSLVFIGNNLFTPAELLAPLRLDTRLVPFSPSAVVNLCRQIELMYQDKGYFFARATAKEKPILGKRRIYEINIVEGTQVRIGDIRIEGAQSFTPAELLGVIETGSARVSRLWESSGSFIRPELLTADLAQIEEFYLERGFLDVKIDFELLPAPQSGTVDIAIKLNEGSRSSISAIEFEWKGLNLSNLQSNSNLLLIGSALKQGSPASASAIDAELQRLSELLINHGYPNAKVETVFDKDPQVLRFIVEPGLKVNVGKIWISGNTAVSDRLITRELLFNTGDILLPNRLRESEQALYSLGYFKTVEIAATDSVLDNEVEDLTVRVSERDTGFIDASVSIDSEDGLHLASELGQRNLGGEGRSVVIGLDGFIKSGEDLLDAGSARAVIKEPHILETRYDLYVEGFSQYSVELLDPYSFDRIGLSTSLRATELDELRTAVGISVFHERLYDVEEDVKIGPDDEGNTFYSFISMQVELDRRDSSFNPRTGYRSLIQGRLNSELLGSSVDFLALTFQHSAYQTISQSYVWSNNFKLNYLEPFSDTEVIPLSQRIFLGGRNSLRGFSLNAVGPRGELGNIVGGDYSFNFNSELQYEISESSVGVLFLDVGQSFLNNKGTFSGEAPNLEDLRYSPGLGFRYRTPIGPISAEIGVNPERENGERWGRFLFGIGGAF